MKKKKIISRKKNMKNWTGAHETQLDVVINKKAEVKERINIELSEDGKMLVC